MSINHWFHCFGSIRVKLMIVQAPNLWWPEPHISSPPLLLPLSLFFYLWCSHLIWPRLKLLCWLLLQSSGTICHFVPCLFPPLHTSPSTPHASLPLSSLCIHFIHGPLHCVWLLLFSWWTSARARTRRSAPAWTKRRWWTCCSLPLRSTSTTTSRIWSASPSSPL